VQPGAADGQPAGPKKVKITYDEYQRFSYLAVSVMKEFDAQGRENVQQSDIINRMVQRMLVEMSYAVANEEKTLETTNKIAHVIQYLINKENILMVAQDSRNKNERFVSLNINVDLQNMNLGS
jgi:hypothetical protein